MILMPEIPTEDFFIAGLTLQMGLKIATGIASLVGGGKKGVGPELAAVNEAQGLVSRRLQEEKLAMIFDYLQTLENMKGSPSIVADANIGKGDLIKATDKARVNTALANSELNMRNIDLQKAQQPKKKGFFEKLAGAVGLGSVFG
jgi:hypothetical protein